MTAGGRTTAGARKRRVTERVYAALLRLYPGAFRAEYGEEMHRSFREWRAERRYAGGVGAVRFLAAAVVDLATSVPREWVAGRRDRLEPVAALQDPFRPPYAAAALAGCAVFALYAATLAPTAAFWDAGEYITVAHILGIPHPPGNLLFVLLAKAWEVLLAPLDLSVAVRVNLLSAAFSAAAHAFWFLVVDRSLAGRTGDRRILRVGAAAAVALSATAFTVWNQSNVNEKVYTIALFTTALVSWLVLRWRDTGRSPKLLVLVGFLVALTATNHLMGVLVAPAVLVFVLLVDRPALLNARLWVAGVPLAALALSVQFFLPLRAADRPLISEGAPTCESAAGAALSVYTWGATGCDDLSAVLQREQYDKPSILVDPTAYPEQELPRGPALVAAQFLNYLQYYDWQWARSIAGRNVLFGGARPLITLLFLMLGVLGARAHWRHDRRGAVYLATLFLTLSVGLVLYLNFRYGYSLGRAPYPVSEVRERDYFFLIGFSVWGLWAGMGLAGLWREAAERMRARVRLPRLAAAPVLGLALLPLALNWGWASRADDYTARDWAYNALMSVEPYGVLVTNGDNDSFPLWYLQNVEGIREDVTIVVSPYLSTDWYMRQIRDLTEPCPAGLDPAEKPTRIVCQRPFDLDELPGPLVEAGWAHSAEPPEDSILPLSDAEIDRLAGTYFITPEPMTFRAGRVETTIARGTTMLPAGIAMAAILRATLGERPIHFMPGSRFVNMLGLFGHTVRVGVTWKIRNGPPAAADAADVVKLPQTALSPVAGAAIHLAITDTLVWEVYLRRGRVLDPDAPWVDAAVTIPMQYVYAHYAAAQGHATRGESAAVDRHVRRASWWQAVIGG